MVFLKTEGGASPVLINAFLHVSKFMVRFCSAEFVSRAAVVILCFNMGDEPTAMSSSHDLIMSIN
jgi:hypothetical protein